MKVERTTVIALVDEASLNDQWLGQAPNTNFRALSAAAGLTPLGNQGLYTLFRVGSK